MLLIIKICEEFLTTFTEVLISVSYRSRGICLPEGMAVVGRTNFK